GNSGQRPVRGDEKRLDLSLRARIRPTFAVQHRVFVARRKAPLTWHHWLWQRGQQYQNPVRPLIWAHQNAVLNWKFWAETGARRRNTIGFVASRKNSPNIRSTTPRFRREEESATYLAPLALAAGTAVPKSRPAPYLGAPKRGVELEILGKDRCAATKHDWICRFAQEFAQHSQYNTAFSSRGGKRHLLGTIGFGSGDSSTKIPSGPLFGRSKTRC